ncbi:hypothetical protein AY599_25830 [Leptolyngbya valderiana BDU 20041]|nr:hypothetical protein AY599_25830 [Leptolyngbya valderiana BDU 20041]
MRTQSYHIPFIFAVPFVALFAGLLVGCNVGPDREIVPTNDPSVLGPVPGDRDDVERALLIGLESAQAALLRGAWDGDTYGASFLAIESRQGDVSATDHGNGTLTLRAFIEPDGDRDAQQALLQAWARRLEQLHGVEWAPR